MSSVRARKSYVFSQRHGLMLDAYWPAEPRDDHVGVLSLHGGGFSEGSRASEDQVEIAEVLTAEGFVVLNADYRLGMERFKNSAPPPRPWELGSEFQRCINLAVEDCIEAINFALANSDRLRLHPDRMVLTGSSAGAITVLQAEYHRANDQINKLGRWRPAAVVAYSGAVVCRNRDFRYRWHPAPTLLVHGLKDRVVSPRKRPMSLTESFFGSKCLKSELVRRHRGGCQAIWAKGAGHEVSMALPETKEFFVDFVDQALDQKVENAETVLDLGIPAGEWKGKTVFDLMPNL